MAVEYIDEEETGDTAMVSPLQMLMGAGFSTVTPEGKAQAAKVFGDLYGKRTAYDEESRAAYDDYEARAQEARDVLRKAREVLAAKKVPTTKWLEMAKGFGSPTRTGAFGESIANYATARIPGKQQEAQWEQDRTSQLLGFDQGMSEIDQKLALQKMQLRQMRAAADDKLMTEAMKIMGRPTPVGKAPPRTPQDRAQAELDKAYVKDYVSFIQGGAADATKNVEELRGAHKALTGRLPGEPIDPKAKGSDTLSGPFVGLLPKIVRDLILPKASETQEGIESTVQRSLKDILGSQFTQVEGERLLARVYNPRLQEDVNARRVAKLVEQLDRAYQEKIKAANYFEQHGTLSGYTGKKSWTMREFEEAVDDDPLANARNLMNSATGQAQVPGAPAPDEGMEEIDIEMLLPAQARGGLIKKKFAEGGSVEGEFPDGRPRFRMPDNKIIRARPGDTYESVLQLYTNATGTAPTRPGLPPQQIPSRGPAPPQQQPAPHPPMLMPASVPPEQEQVPAGMDQAIQQAPALLGRMAAGAGAGATASALPGIMERTVPGMGENAAQRRILDMLQERGVSPQTLANATRQNQRMGIPAMAMDDPSVRPLADSVISESGMPNATEALRRLQERQGNIGERVMERVNLGLKPDEYFDQLDKLKDNLYQNASPLYDQAYAANPSVKSKVLPALLETPDGKKAVKTALRLMRNQGKKIGKADAMGMVQAPSLEFLDNVKRGFDQLITQEEGHGANYKATPLGASIRKLRDQLRDELDVATTPTKGDSLYRKAREQYAGDLEVLDALQTGREQFSKLQPKELDKAFKAMSFAEKDAYRTGVAQKLFETIEGPTTEFNAAQRIVGSPAQRKKLRVLFDNDKQYQLFETALVKEAEIYEASKKSISRGEAGQEVHAEPKPTIAKKVQRHVPRLGIGSPTMWALQFIRNNSQASEKKLDEVMRYLKSSTPDELANMEKTLGPKFKKRIARKGRAGKAAALGAGVGAGVYAAEALTEDEDDAEQE